MGKKQSKLKRYNYVGNLGKGGFGTVGHYKIKKSGLDVAIKSIDLPQKEEDRA